jgi:hypothetical protein
MVRNGSPGEAAHVSSGHGLSVRGSDRRGRARQSRFNKAALLPGEARLVIAVTAVEA